MSFLVDPGIFMNIRKCSDIFLGFLCKFVISFMASCMRMGCLFTRKKCPSCESNRAIHCAESEALDSLFHLIKGDVFLWLPLGIFRYLPSLLTCVPRNLLRSSMLDLCFVLNNFFYTAAKWPATLVGFVRFLMLLSFSVTSYSAILHFLFCVSAIAL